MTETTDTVLCARVGDLVAYFYGEANENEALSFQTHLNDCTTCRAEIAAFGEVREGIVAWRDEALSPMAMTASHASTARDVVKARPGRSALVAIREYFTMSPLWLRGATAFASILFVALLLVTTLQFFKSPESQVAQQTPSATGIKDEKLNGGAQAGPGLVQPVAANTRHTDTADASVIQPDAAVNKTVTRTKSNRREKAAALSNEERSQLSDLLIAEKEDEESVPRLYDLLYESN